jgi:hypothetical protein
MHAPSTVVVYMHVLITRGTSFVSLATKLSKASLRSALGLSPIDEEDESVAADDWSIIQTRRPVMARMRYVAAAAGLQAAHMHAGRMQYCLVSNDRVHY